MTEPDKPLYPLPEDGSAVTCEDCRRVRHIGNFDRSPGGITGYLKTCRDCNNKAEATKAAANLEQNVRKLDKSTMKVLDDITRISSKTGSKEALPHLATAMEDLMAVFGGSKGWAAHMATQYLASPAGGANRQKIMDSVMRGIIVCSNENYVERPLHLLSNEELEELNAEKMRRFAESVGIKIHDDDSESAVG